MKKIKLDTFLYFNPSESLVGLKEVKKIPLDALNTNLRKIDYFEISKPVGGAKFRNGDTLVAKITPSLENGKTGLVKILNEGEVGLGSTEFIVLRANEHSDSNFIYYLARSPMFRERAISLMEGTSGRKRVNESSLRNTDFVLPTLSIQRKIAHVLSVIDEKIELNIKMNDKLEQIAQRIYEYWFLQFDFPDENNNPYSANGGNMLYSSEVNYKIPKNWKVKKLSEIIINQRSGDWGKSTSEKNYSEKVNIIRGADLNSLLGNKPLKTPERFISEKNLGKQLEVGDFIVEISGGGPTQSTGRIAYINQGVLDRFDLPVLSSNFTKAISLTNENLLNLFYLYWTKLYESDAFFKYEGKTSGIKNLLFERFINENYIVIPPSELLFKFENIIKPIFQKIQQNNLESKKLEDQRDFLLPMLINGQINVDNVQID